MLKLFLQHFCKCYILIHPSNIAILYSTNPWIVFCISWIQYCLKSANTPGETMPIWTPLSFPSLSLCCPENLWGHGSSVILSKIFIFNVSGLAIYLLSVETDTKQPISHCWRQTVYRIFKHRQRKRYIPTDTDTYGSYWFSRAGTGKEEWRL